MVTGAQPVFLCVISFFLVHELDAIRQAEWRFFFSPVRLSDEVAFKTFTALHAPLFVVILAYMESSAFQIGLDLFAIIDGHLHFSLRNHHLTEFDSWFSRFWIFGGSLLGGLHLVLIF